MERRSQYTTGNGKWTIHGRNKDGHTYGEVVNNRIKRGRRAMEFWYVPSDPEIDWQDRIVDVVFEFGCRKPLPKYVQRIIGCMASTLWFGKAD